MGGWKLGSGEGVARTLADSLLSEAYKAHADTLQDRLFIGKPTIDPETKRWSLQLSRSIRDANGSFSGVIVAALDPRLPHAYL